MMFNEWEFLDRFAAAADAGFHAVEFLFPYAFAPEDIANRLQRHGLTQALFNLPAGDWNAGERGLAALPHRAAEFDASVATALPYVAATGVKRVHVMSGNAQASEPIASEAYQRSIRYAAERMGERGVEVVIEPINTRDMPEFFLNDFALALDIIRAIGAPNLKLQYDIYHRQILHGDVMKSLEALLPLIGHIQVASVPARNEPGTGELDDDRIFRHLDAIGYSGFVGCEYRPAGKTLDGLGWLAPWREA
jgi:hydroxypyruvate isomerase